MTLYLTLFITFLKIGAFTFGGGYAMIALIQNEVVVRHAWMSAQEFTDLLAVSQMTPGPIGINTATYAGYTAIANTGAAAWQAVLGAAIASVAVILIPMTLMLIVCRCLRQYHDKPIVQYLLSLLRIAIVGLMAAAALSLFTFENFGTPALSQQFILSIAIFLATMAVSLLPVESVSIHRSLNGTTQPPIAKICLYLCNHINLKSPIALILLAALVGVLFMH